MDLRWPLRIVEERRGRVLVLALAGRISAASAVQLKTALGAAIGRGESRLVLDLTEIDYISSAGLNVLAAAAGGCADAGGALVLCGLMDAVRIALDLGGMLDDIPTAGSRDHAVLSIAGYS